MAIQNARILIRRGNEVDFDANNMQPGEWALSTDEKIVRICVAPGVCIRMATYDAFEVDMAKIEKILEECQTIEDAVKLINSQVSDKLNAVIEYTNQAKQYRDEAKQFRDEAEQFSPDGYTELQETVASNTAKIDTIIEKAELNIKNTASGDTIHLTDSTDNKVTAFALYGKATQKSTTGKNLCPDISGNYTVYTGAKEINLPAGTYTISLDISSSDTDNSESLVIVKGNDGATILTFLIYRTSTLSKQMAEFTLNDTAVSMEILSARSYDKSSGDTLVINNVQIERGTVATPYEPYTGGMASPNPNYPQEIEVAGASGSVEVKSVGKNLLQNTATTKTVNGITFTVNEDGSVSVKGTNDNTSGGTVFDIPLSLINGVTYIANGISGGSYADGCTVHFQNKLGSVTLAGHISNGEKKFTKNDSDCDVEIYRIRVAPSATVDTTIYPMIRLASDTDGTYQPYKESIITIPTPNGLPGIPVSSNGNYTDENGQQWICDEIVKYADGSGKRIQRIGKAVLNGTESWSVNSLRFSSKIASGNTNNAICSHAMKRTAAEMLEAGNGFYLYTSGYMDFANSSYTTVEDFKEWLKSNNVTVYYELATPIITDLTAEEIAEIEKLHTFYPITNISNDSDCGMSVTYIADSKLYIDNQLAIQKAQQEEALATMLLLMPEEVQASMIENDTNNLLNESEV